MNCEISNENKIKFSVKMGSNKFKINLKQTFTNDFNKQQITSIQLIEYSLKYLKLNSDLAKTYSLYESINGIERLLKRNQNLISILNQWSSQKNVKLEFVIRKQTKSESKLQLKLKQKQNKLVAEKCFKKLNNLIESQHIQQKQHQHQHQHQQQLQLQNKSIHVYEDINQEEELIKKLFENEQVLEIQTKQLELLDKKILKKQKQNQFKILKSIYSKLKLSNNNSKSLLNDSTSSCKFLIEQDLNSCANSCDESQSKASSRTCSTTTLESLV